ncbi:hypothetical protein Theos_2359 (plasmid) [Thermus oshimai JL-2]|uniref:Uncharacterized protein n=1 Tax=Thermus oshimai JL-2 TaxID=751945 RepID=K7R231_THEOS|nr:hypothetical protein Theos_2359 [Thermus oshimai JL-2]
MNLRLDARALEALRQALLGVGPKGGVLWFGRVGLRLAPGEAEALLDLLENHPFAERRIVC